MIKCLQNCELQHGSRKIMRKIMRPKVYKPYGNQLTDNGHRIMTTISQTQTFLHILKKNVFSKEATTEIEYKSSSKFLQFIWKSHFSTNKTKAPFLKIQQIR